MSATVQEEILYEAICTECPTASGPFENEDDAEEWAANHNAELHAEDDGNDEAYEKFKEARNGD
ncbi:hypothetical protein ACFFGR_09465 [Arthrobacter liuii]|nr:hypothetical protein [Arthrobacter liuii]